MALRAVFKPAATGGSLGRGSSRRGKPVGFSALQMRPPTGGACERSRGAQRGSQPRRFRWGCSSGTRAAQAGPLATRPWRCCRPTAGHARVAVALSAALKPATTREIAWAWLLPHRQARRPLRPAEATAHRRGMSEEPWRTARLPTSPLQVGMLERSMCHTGRSASVPTCRMLPPNGGACEGSRGAQCSFNLATLGGDARARLAPHRPGCRPPGLAEATAH